MIQQNRELFDKLQFANLNIKRLRDENTVLKEKLDILNNQLNKLNEKVKAYNETAEVKPEDGNATENHYGKAESSEPVELPAETEYGAKIIGDIVLQSVNYSNRLSVVQKSNVKELVNLILGKTEVAKSEVLNIVLSDVSLENKFQMMDTVYNETIEYFKSILEQ